MKGSLRIISGGSDLASSRLALPLILVLQATLSLVLLRNTAFEDEALYLFAGRQIIRNWRGEHLPVGEYGSYFSGYPTLHPVIAGMLDMAAGLEAARMFSLICMLGVTACVFAVTRLLIDRRSAALAALLFAFQASVLFLGRLATHDSICLLMLAAAMLLALQAGDGGSLWQAAAMGPILALAVASKYAGLLFVPSIIALLAWRSFRAHGLQKMTLIAGISLCALILSCLVVYQVRSEGVLQGFYVTTLHRVVSGPAPLMVMLEALLKWGGLIFGLAVIGLAMNGVGDAGTGLLLFGTALLAPAFQLAKGEMVSLHKHVAFALFFIMPLAGFVVARLLAGRHRTLSLSRIAGLAICIFALMTGLQQASILYHGWSSSSELVHLLKTEVRPGNRHYLAEEFNVARYYLQDRVESRQWTSLDYFVYTDEEGQHHSGKDAYVAATHEGYFELIELNFGARAGLARAIRQVIDTDGQYDLIAKTSYPNSFGPGYFWVWRRKPKSPR